MPRINVCIKDCGAGRLHVTTASEALGWCGAGASRSKSAGAEERKATSPRTKTHSRCTAELPTRDSFILLLRGPSMPRGRTTALTVRLTPAERQTLRAWQRSTRLPASLARRGRILLLLADGRTITDIAATVGLSRRHTYKWIQRFVQEGLEGLTDRPTTGRPRIELRRDDLRNQHEMDVG